MTNREKALKLINEYLAKQEPQKVELALVDDAKKVVSEYSSIDEDNAFGFVVKAEMEYKDVLNKYEQLLKEVERITPRLEKAIQEIGINRNNFGVLDDLDSRKSDIKERISVIKRNINDLKAINPS
jgi:DNA repair exonuclease SbcCD ATPase subunit